MKWLTQIAAETQRRDFVTFAKRGWHIVEPKDCVWNWHMDALCEHLVYVTMRQIRNFMVLFPPRMTKSLIVSVLWPSWDWLINPADQFLGASHSSDLALRDAVASRRVMESGWYRRFYSDAFYLLSDSNKSDRYINSEGGYRITTSVSGNPTGDGGDILLLDDPHSASKIESDSVRNNGIAWHDNAWRSRMNNPNTTQKVYAGQRTHDSDIFGHVLRQERERWVVLDLPMEFDTTRRCITFPNKGMGVEKDAKPIFKDPRQVEGELLNPKRFDKRTAATEKEVMSERAWQAQYQQKPEGAGGLILKRHWWKKWEWPSWHPQFKEGEERPLPEFFEIIQVYDTAFEEDESADFTARTTWGLFLNSDSFEDPLTKKTKQKERVCALLLDRYKDRPSFPDLRKEMIESYNARRPDLILIEKKASGHSLRQEARKKRLPVRGVKVPSGMDLTARAHAASLVLEKGCIYYVVRNWSLDVIDECAVFPNGEHDDQVSSAVMAWQYMRRYYDLTLPDDDDPDEDIDPFKWQRRQVTYA